MIHYETFTYVRLKIGKLNAVLNDYLRDRAFRPQGSRKAKFPKAMQDAFRECVGQLTAVAVSGLPSDERPRYVIEVDVAPQSKICGDMVFGYCNVKTGV